VLVAALAFWLSYNALTLLAVRAGIGAGQAWAWPLIVDGIIVVSTVAVVALKDRPGSGYAWVLLIAGAAVSVTANAVHAAMPAGARLSAPLAAAVSAVPPVVLLAITHLTVVLTRPRQHEPPAGVPRSGGRVPAAPAIAGRPVVGAGRPGGPVSPQAPGDEGAGVPRGPGAGQARPGLGPSGASRRGGAGVDERAGEAADGAAAAQDGASTMAVAGEARRTLGREDARRLKGEGLTNRAIAQMLGVNPATVGRWLRTETTGDAP
jgi:hypothetical protein